MPGRRKFLAVVGWPFLPLPLDAADFPVRPITLIVPFSAGGPMDLLARVAAQEASSRLGQPVIVDNRGGAAGVSGAASVARADPDGYTLLLASAAQVTIPPWVNRVLTFDPPRDLMPVAHLVDMPMVLVVAQSSTARTVDDFVTMARANRGGLNYASTGVGTISHLVMETLKLTAELDIVHVPYRGAMPALYDLHGGQVQAMFTGTGSAAAMVGSGKLRPLAVTTTSRSPLFPDVPTMAEAGWPAAEVVVWAGIMAPAGTPRIVTRQLERAFIQAILAQDLRARLIRLGADPVGHGAKAFSEVLERDLALWQRVVLASGVNVE